MSNSDAVLAAQFGVGTAVSGFGDSNSAGAQQLSAGSLLREAREAAGLHIETLAVSLKVPVKKLEALEQDRVDLLPDMVFARALAASVCRSLRLDPALVLARLPQTAAPVLADRSASINTPFRASGQGSGSPIGALVSRPAVLAGLVLLMGALVLIFFPAIKPSSESVVTMGASLAERASSAIVPGQADEVTTIPSAVVTEVLTPAVGPVVSMALVSPQTVDPMPAPAAMLTVPTAALSVAATAVNPVVPVVPVTPPSIVTFSTKSASWVEVTDAKGTVVLRRMLAAGEVAGVSGVLPLKAVVGKADVTQVQVRGQALDLAALTRDNVARFEVK